MKKVFVLILLTFGFLTLSSNSYAVTCERYERTSERFLTGTLGKAWFGSLALSQLDNPQTCTLAATVTLYFNTSSEGNCKFISYQKYRYSSRTVNGVGTPTCDSTHKLAVNMIQQAYLTGKTISVHIRSDGNTLYGLQLGE